MQRSEVSPGYLMNNRQIEMYNIAICIPTYKRPLWLRRLILSIFNGNIDRTLINNLWVIIVDNDIEKTAENIIIQMKEGDQRLNHIYYYHYAVKGYANVRNELFKRALAFNPDYITCIDDDEYATDDWLNQLLITITSNHSHIAIGPVIRICETTVPKYISYWFTSYITNNSSNIRSFGTGNFIISVSFLINNNLNFDNRFNESGGEDLYFSVNAINKNAKILLAKEAIAYETVPESRATIKWLMRRFYRTALTYSYVMKIEKKYFALFIKFVICIVYLFFGLLALFALLLPIKRKLWGLIKISESIGGIVGIIRV